MKKIISFSLWGNNPKYTVGALRNAQLAPRIYSDWIPRFYIGTSTNKIVSEKLRSLGAETIIIHDNNTWEGSFWRFLPASDKEVSVMISRDCDSRLNDREKAAVDDWLKSTNDFHIMRDHPAHTVPIMAGMWGVRNGLLKDMDVLISKYNKSDFWQVDQNFLKEIIFPLVVKTSTIHDEFYQKTSFPTKRVGNEFVGDVYDENNIRHPEFWKDIEKNLK